MEPVAGRAVARSLCGSTRIRHRLSTPASRPPGSVVPANMSWCTKRSIRDDLPRRVFAIASRWRRSKPGGKRTGTLWPWCSELPILHPSPLGPTPTVAGNGSRCRAAVRSMNGTSSAACGTCHKPASSRAFSRHGFASGARTRRSGVGPRTGRGMKLLPAASANGRYAAARRSRRAWTAAGAAWPGAMTARRSSVRHASRLSFSWTNFGSWSSRRPKCR